MAGIRVIVRAVSIYEKKIGRERVFELESPMTIEEFLDKYLPELREESVRPIVFVNYRFPREGQVLGDGDVVLLVPPFAGG